MKEVNHNLAIFWGSNGITIGPVKINSNWEISAKLLGDWKKAKPTFRYADVNYHYVEVPEIDPQDKKLTGRNIPIYLFDLIEGSPISLGKNTPQELALKFKSMTDQLNSYRNENEELKKILRNNNIRGYEKKVVSEIVADARKMLNNPYSPSFNQNNQSK